MAHSSRRNIRAALRPFAGLALAGSIAGCASTPAVSTGYPLGNGGKPLAQPGTVCVQIGPLAAAREDHGQCYQLVPPGPEHVEPLPLDEFGYLYPPLKPEPKPAPAATLPTPLPAVHSSSAKPAAATAVPARPAAAFATKVVEFSTSVPFRLNSAHLDRTNRSALTTFVNSLERYRGVVDIEVTGHTDRSGSTRFNQWLSRMRAQSVRLHLLALGMDPRHIRIHGAGSSQPRPQARAAADNRYVDLQVTVRVPEQ